MTFYFHIENMDKTDQRILKILKENAKTSLKEIGERVHKSGQAVGLRIKKLEEQQIIQNYTINIHYPDSQLITIFMDSNNFVEFENFIQQDLEHISEFYKISGEGCYIIKSHFGLTELQLFLDNISKYCRYKVNHLTRQLV